MWACLEATNTYYYIDLQLHPQQQQQKMSDELRSRKKRGSELGNCREEVVRRVEGGRERETIRWRWESGELIQVAKGEGEGEGERDEVGRKPTGRLKEVKEERETYLLRAWSHVVLLTPKLYVTQRCVNWVNTTPFRVVISVTCAFCKGPKLDAYGSGNVTLANCQYDSIRQQEWLFSSEKVMCVMRFGVAHWGALDDCLAL